MRTRFDKDVFKNCAILALGPTVVLGVITDIYLLWQGYFLQSLVTHHILAWSSSAVVYTVSLGFIVWVMRERVWPKQAVEAA